MKRTHTLIAGLVAGASLAFAAATYAQPYGGGWATAPDPARAWAMAWAMVKARWPARDRGPASIVPPGPSRTWPTMKSQLKITSAQEAAWQAFATKAKEQAASHAGDARPDAASTRQRRRSGWRSARRRCSSAPSRMATMTDAFVALYAVLTPEQKAIADQSFGPMGGRGKHRGGRAG